MQNDQIVIYKSENVETIIDGKLENETIWLTQAQIVDLFKRDQSVISRHIRNISSPEDQQSTLLEPYMVNKKYNSVFVFKK